MTIRIDSKVNYKMELENAKKSKFNKKFYLNGFQGAENSTLIIRILNPLNN